MWFDAEGQRAWLRHRLWRTASPLNAAPLEATFVIEQEQEYSDLIAYCAYRTGRSVATQIHTRAEYDRMVTGLTTKQTSRRRVIHSHKFTLGETALQGDLTATCKALGIQRFVVTADPTVQLDPPRGASSESHRTYGLRKPLGWIHHLLPSGLVGLEAWDNQVAFFDGYRLHELGGGAGESADLHAAEATCLAISSTLIRRSRKAVSDGEHVIGAVMALDAVRMLRGHSVTLFLDAIDQLYRAEAMLEVNLAAAVRGARGDSVVRRREELDRLLETLVETKRLQPDDATYFCERTWTALRSIYQNGGAFAAAETALATVHRLGTWRHAGKSSVRGSGWWRGGVTALAIGCAAAMPWLAANWGFAGPHYAAMLLGAVALLALAGVTDPSRLLFKGMALTVGRWLGSLGFAIVFFAGTNLHMMADDPDLFALARGAAALYSVDWTVSTLSSAQVTLNPIEVTDVPTVWAAAHRESGHCSSGGHKGDGDLDVPEKRFTCSFAFLSRTPGPEQSMLWAVEMLSGWWLFASGVSVIYRRVVRG